MVRRRFARGGPAMHSPATRYSPGAASRGGLPYLDETAGVNIVDVTVNRNFAGNERMLANATHVIRHARRLIRDCMPFYESTGTGSVTVRWIRPKLAVKIRRFQIVIK